MSDCECGRVCRRVALASELCCDDGMVDFWSSSLRGGKGDEGWGVIERGRGRGEVLSLRQKQVPEALRRRKLATHH